MTTTPNRAVALVAAGCAAALLLTGCASASGTGATATAAAPGGAPSGAPGGRQAGARVPGTFGLIAEITGTTLQVQGASGQNAVTWSDVTSFTEQVTGTAADLVAGSCVSVRSSSVTASATGTTTAPSVTVSEPVDGQCVGLAGGAGRPGGVRSGMPTDAPPEGMPSGMPSGAPGGWAGGITGTVVSLVDGVLTVSVTRPGDPAAASTETVVVDAATTVRKTVAASASALAVGRCAWANGSTDSTGTVAAISIRLSDAVGGACTMS